MNQHKETARWEKRKIEVEKILKEIQRKREKTLYLYNIEKQSRRKTKEVQLRTLLDYETRELQKARAELQNITSRIAAIESEEKKYNNFRIIGLLSLVVMILSIVGLVTFSEYESEYRLDEKQEAVKDLTRLTEQSWSSSILSILQKYAGSTDNNFLTGAAVGIPESGIGENCHEETICVNETIEHCVDKIEEVCEEQCVPECITEMINGQPREVCNNGLCTTTCHPETVQVCTPEIVEKCTLEIVCDTENEIVEAPVEETIEKSTEPQTTEEETPSLGIQGIDIQAVPALTLVLNTTNLATNDSNANLTAYNTTQTNGTSLKVIYNWLRNNTQIAVLNMPFEGINGTSYNNSYDYSGLQNNGNETGGIVWNATGGYDGKGAYMFDQSNDYIDLGDRDFFKGQLCVNGCTFNAWINPRNETNTNTNIIMARQDTTGQDQFFTFGMGALADLFFTIYFNGSSGGALNCHVQGESVLNQNEWAYVTGRYNVTHNAIFINGTQMGATACGFSAINTTAWADSEKTFIGARDDSSTTGFFNGTIDEVTIFNRSLSVEQIYALWQNKTNVIVAQETSRGENWSVQATPNNGTGDGNMVTSNNVTILNTAPNITALELNTTNRLTNDSNVNLTAHVTTSDADGHSVKVIYNWLRNGTSITVLNMPFEGINNTASNNAWDYSGIGINGSENGSIFWNSTGGHDGKGAYRFDGLNDYISLGNSYNQRLKGGSAITLSAWVYLEYWEAFDADATVLSQTRNQFASTHYDMWMDANSTTGDPGVRFLIINRSFALHSTLSTSVFPQKTWTHVVGRYDGATEEISIWINGVKENSKTGVGVALTTPSTGRFTIGAVDLSTTSIGTYFNGSIDDVMVFNRSLSAEQIYALYQNKTDIIVANETIKGENWSVQATPNDGFADGTMVTSNNVTILNTKPVLNTLVLNTTDLLTNDTNVNLTAIATTSDADNDPVKVIYNWIRDTTPINVLNMPFERINNTATNNAWDYSGFGNNGSDGSAMVWNSSGGYDGKGAYMFDGTTNSVIQVSDDDSLDFNGTSQKFSISFWTKTKNATAAGVVLEKGISSTCNHNYAFFMSSEAKQMTFSISNSTSCAGPFTRVDSNFLLSPEKFIHVAGVYNGTSLLLYINGTLDNIAQSSVPPLSRTADILIGGLTSNWNGTIDELQIWNRSLSAEQIYALWQNKTDIIVANETIKGENWSVQATPNDGFEDGALAVSNNVTILNTAPNITTLILNTTNLLTNRTDVNLTAYTTTSDAESDSVKVIYNWLRNNTPIAVLNMPFEQINNTATNNSWDYSGYGNNGKDQGTVLWNASGGYDGKGAYQFRTGSGERITISDSSSFGFTNSFSLSFWIKPNTTSGTHRIMSKRDGGGTHFDMYQLNAVLQMYNGSVDATINSTAFTANVWHHIVITVNETGLQYFALNGNVYPSGGIGTDYRYDNADLVIGNFYDGSQPFGGTIDEVVIWNRTLSQEQIYALWQNQTNVITASETAAGENWSVQATPNDGTEDGARVTSNNVSIRFGQTPPTIDSLILNTTNILTNKTDVNLTAYVTTSDINGDSVKVIYNWLRNNTPIAVLNMPFEGINNTATNNAWDYSGYRRNGSENGGIIWNATSGYDGKGAYMFDAVNDYINVPMASTEITIGVSMFARIYVNEDINNCPLGTCAIAGAGSNFLWELNGNTLVLYNYNVNTPAFISSTATLKNNTWFHVGFTYWTNNSVGNVTFYINGVESGSTQNAGLNGTFRIPTFRIGDDIGRLFNGTIDEFVIFNRTLSSDEIYALWQNQTHVITASETIAGENWSVQATPNDGFEDGARVNSNNVTILNTAPNITSLVLNTTNRLTNDTNVNLTAHITTSDADGHSVKVIYNWLRDTTPIALLNMPFEGINGTATNNSWDYSGLGKHGKDRGNNILWNSSGGYDSKGAYQLDGVSDIITTPASSTVNFTVGLTFMAWVKRNDEPENGNTIIGSANSNAAGYYFLISTTSNITTLRLGGNTVHGEGLINAFNNVPANEWTHLAGTWHPTSGFKIYNNGILHTNTTTTTNFSLWGGSATAGFAIGVRRESIPDNYFNGTIDEVMIFNRTLSPEQIWNIYANRSYEIASNETIKGENWSVQATPNDGFEDGAMVTSNNVTILNTAPPAPVLVSPANLSTTTSRTPTFIWNNSVDADGDSNISYRLIIDDSIVFNNPEVDVSGILNTTNDNTTYAIITELNVDTTYFWRVAAYDQTAYGDNSSTRNFTVQSLLSINVTADTAAFGTLPAGANVSTPNNASSLRAENVGNIIANVTVTGTPFFTAVSMPSTFYRFKIRANESGAFNVTASATEWNETNTTLGADVFHVINLDWHSISNDFLTDLNISVPLNESAGYKSSVITFTITG